MQKNMLIKIMGIMLGSILMVGTVMAMPADAPPVGPEGSKHGRPPMGPGVDMPEGPPPFLAALDLGEEQLKKLKKNKISKHRKTIRLRGEMEEAKLDLAEELDISKPNIGKIEKIAKKIGDLHERQVLLHADSIVFLKSILTKEQLRKLETMMLMRGGPEGGWGVGMERGQSKKRHHRGHKKRHGMGQY